YLQARSWQRFDGYRQPVLDCEIPKGIVILHLVRTNATGGHMCTVIDHVVHDTWNPTDDDDYVVMSYWTPPVNVDQPGISTIGTRPQANSRQELTQQEFDKILRRLRALDNTASNSASTEGEKHNALRMMHDLMLRHNLSRDDIVDDDNVEGVQFTRRACPLNSRRACTWEIMLARYIVEEIFPTVQWYSSTRGHRTMIWYYGPRSDVENCLAVFRELLLTIATSAMLQYGGYTRGSGASYAEGYVSGLPRSSTADENNSASSSGSSTSSVVSERSLIQTRTLVLHGAATKWLDSECNVRLTTSRRSGRGQRDPAAANRGREHGASHKLDVPGARKRITGN
ncbi:MAG: DUF2786 domain-containing protein, partial [Pirellulaceae bacterium]|nr:DUF2786 domain-containing protein [Pirellulaceae bacterium]